MSEENNCDFNELNDEFVWHPVAISTCDSDEYCVTPGQVRKVNVYYDRGAPVLHICKGCARSFRKKGWSPHDPGTRSKHG